MPHSNQLPDTPTKRQLRSHLLQRRARMSVSHVAQALRSQWSHLHAGLTASGATTVAAYAPMGREPGGDDLPRRLHNAGFRVLLPLLRADNDLDWAVYDGTLVAARFGLREPDTPRLGVTAIGEADVAIVPALAVGRDGMRLGRGGGSYDRVVDRMTATAIVALLYDGEWPQPVPSEPHDRPVTHTVTPSSGWSPAVC